MVTGADPIQGQDNRVGVLVRSCSECEGERVRSGPCPQGELVRRRGLLDRISELRG